MLDSDDEQQGTDSTALAEFDRLTKKKRATDSTALAEFDRLTGSKPARASTSSSPDSGDIDLGNPPGRLSAVKPDVRREPPAPPRNVDVVMTTDRFGLPVGLEERPQIDTRDERKPIPVRRRTGELPAVTVEADPSKVTVSRADRVKRDWGAAVQAETRAGLDRAAAGQPTDLRRPAPQPKNFNAAGLRAEAENARLRAKRLREQHTVEADNEASDLEARADNTDLLVDKLSKTDTAGQRAIESATFGYANLEDERAIDRLRGDDLVLAPEDQEGRVRPIGTERPFSATKDLLAPMAGQLAPIMAGGLVGRVTALAIGEAAAARGLPRIASIARSLGTYLDEAEPMLGPRQRGLAGAGERVEEFMQRAPQIARRGAIQGNVIGTAGAANEARLRGDPDWASRIPQMLTENAIVGATGELALGGASTLLGGSGDVARDLVRRRVASIGDALDRHVEAVSHIDDARADKTPISDKTEEAQGHALAHALNALETHLSNRRVAETPAVDRRVEARPPEAKVWSQEERARYIAEHQRRFIRSTGDKLWSEWTPEEKEAYFADQQRVRAEAPWKKTPAPEEAPTLADNFDMSKNLDRITAENAERDALDEQARVTAEAAARGEEPPPPRTPQERLERARAAYDKAKSAVPEPVRENIPKIAFAAAATAAGAREQDEDKRAALYGAAALSTGGMKLPFKPEEIVERYRNGASTRTLRHEYGLTKAEIHNLLDRHGVERRSEPKEGTPPRDETPYLNYHIGPEVKQQIVAAAREAGGSLSTRELARRFGTTPATVATTLKAAGEARSWNRSGLSLHDVLRSADERGISVDQMRKALRMLGATEAADKVKRVGGKLLLPAAIGAAAINTDDPEKRKLLAGLGLALTTGVHEDAFHSRLRRAIEEMPPKWEKPQPAADWIGKLSSGSGTFSKGEYDMVLKPFLENAKVEKRKVTKDELLGEIAARAPQMKIGRRTPGTRDIVAHEEPVSQTRTLRARAAAPGTGYNGLHYDLVEGGQRGEGDATLRIRNEWDNRLREANQQLQEYDDRSSNYANDFYQATEDAGIPRSVVERALERHSNDDDGGWKVERVMEAIQDHLDPLPGEGVPELPDSYQVVENPDSQGDYDKYKVQSVGGGRVRGYGGTKLEAMAEFQRQYGYNELGNLSSVLGEDSQYRVARDPEDPERWAIIRRRDGEVLETNADRDALVEQWVEDRYEFDNSDDDRLYNIRSELEHYSNAAREYEEYERDTYDLREGDLADNHEFQSELEDAADEDEQALTNYLNNKGLTDYDREFYMLPENDQDFVRTARMDGAVGTKKPLLGDEYHPLHSHDLVFDPNEPHVPLPRPGQPANPISAEEAATLAAMKTPASSFPRREPAILKATGSSKFTGSQVTPGGSNYRELTVHWGNPPQKTPLPKGQQYFIEHVPADRANGYTQDRWVVRYPPDSNLPELTYAQGYSEAEAQQIADTENRYKQQDQKGGWRDYTADHWGGDPPNTAVHSRLEERIYRGDKPPELPEKANALLVERDKLSAKQAELVQRLEEQEAAVGPDPNNATPEMRRLAGEWRAIVPELQRIDKEYNEALNAAGLKPTPRDLRVTNLIEAQSDWYQVGEAGGYLDTNPMHPDREAALRAEQTALRDEKVKTTEEYNNKMALLDPYSAASADNAELQELKTLTDKIYYGTGATPEERLRKNELEQRFYQQRQELAQEYSQERTRLDTRAAEVERELEGSRLEPGEAERLKKQKEKAAERLNKALEAQTQNRTPENSEAVRTAQKRVDRLSYSQPVPALPKPFRDAQVVFGMAAATGLKEAAEAGSDAFSWSHSTNRMDTRTARLPKAAAEITYDNALVNSVKRLMKGLGFDVKPEVVEMDGYKHWMIRLTPEMRAAIKKASFPLMSALTLLAAPSEAKAQDGGESTGRSAVPYLIAAGLAAGAFKALPREMRARLAARAKEFTLARGTFTDAMKQLKRAPTTAAVAAAATIASNSEDPKIKDTSPWLFGLAALHQIGSANLAKGRGKIGKALVDQLVKTRAGEGAVRLANPAALIHPEAQAAILAYEATRAKGTARQVEFTKKLKALGPLGDRIVSDLREGETFENPEDVRALPPEELHNIVNVAQEAMEEVERGTKMMIESGALHPDAAIPHYLPGKYAYWEALDALTERAPRGRGPTDRPRILPVKQRTIPREDISARNKLGEIRESSYRVGVAIEKAYANSAAATLFKTLRAIPDVIHPEYQAALDDFLTGKDLMREAKASGNQADMESAKAMLDEAHLKATKISARFKLRGGDYVTLPESKSMGVLSGMVVKRDIANELNGLPERRATDKLLRFWKQSKTVFNPGTHVANVVSNTTMAHMGGMRMTEQPIWLTKAAADMRSYGPGTRALAEAGQLDLNAVTAGSEGTTARSARSEKGLSELMQTTRPETAKVLREVGITDPKKEATPTFNKAAKKTRELYNNEDNVFRVAMYLKANAEKKARITFNEPNGMGMSHEQSLKHVQETFGNFRTRSPLVRMIRGSVAPFILYPLKAVPAFAKNVVDHPLRYLTLIASWGALDQYAQHEVGAVPDTDLDERDRRSYGYFFPGLVQLPKTNKRGEKAMENLARWTPMSGITDVAQPGVTASAINSRWPQIATPSGPATDIWAKFYGNIDTYTGNRRYSLEKPAKRNIGQLLEDAADVALPSALSFHRRRIMEDVANRDPDALRTDLPGLAGLRPRYIRPGAAARSAGITMEKALQDARAEASRALEKSRSRERNEAIIKQYREYVAQIIQNYRGRVSPEREQP